MIHTFKHASKNFKDTRKEKIISGLVVTFSDLNLSKIMDFLESSDVSYIARNLDSKVYYLCKPLKSSSLASKKNWNEILNIRYNSEISAYENSIMERVSGIDKNFNHDNFRFFI